MINGADACNVFWQVGSSATLGTTSSFTGTIMALTSISVTTGTTVKGRALARNGQVSLDKNTFTTPDCGTTPTPTPTSTSTPTSTPTETPVPVPTAVPAGISGGDSGGGGSGSAGLLGLILAGSAAAVAGAAVVARRRFLHDS